MTISFAQAAYIRANKAYGQHVESIHGRWQAYCTECDKLAHAITQAAGDLVLAEAHH